MDTPKKKAPTSSQPKRAVRKTAARKTGSRGAEPRARQPSEASLARRNRRIEDKRNTILVAALELFSRFGLYGTSLDQVAAQADVSKTNLLYYFPNKEDLYVSVLKDLLAGWLEPFRAFSADQDPREAMCAYIRRKLAASRDNPEASRLFCLEMIHGAPLLGGVLDKELRELVDDKAAVVQSWIARGLVAPVEPRHLFFSLWATTQHYADFAAQVRALTGSTLADPEFFEQTVRDVQRIVLDGALSVPQTNPPA